MWRMNSKLYKFIFCCWLGCLIVVGEFIWIYGWLFLFFGKKIINDNYMRVGKLSYLVILIGLVFGILFLLVFVYFLLLVNGNIVVG